MAQQNINFGRFPTDPSADSLRIAFQKAQSNFTELYTNQSAQVTKVYADRGLTQNRTSGDVTLYANISSVTVQTSTNLKVGVTTASGRSATITTYETPLVFDIDPNIVVNSVTSNLLIGTIAASSNSQPNITSVGTLTSLNVSGNIDASWVNASINGPVVSPGSNNYVILNQSGLLGASSGLTYNGTELGVTGNTTISGNITAGNIDVGNLITASNFSGPSGSAMQVIGNLNVGGNLSAGNISSGIINGSFNGSIGAITPDAGVFTGITVNDNLSANGDITSVTGVFYGNGSGLTNVNASNISGSVSTANSVNHSLTPGAYLTGSAFNGSADITFAVDGTSTATANKVAIRDGSGGLEATTFVGNLQYSISNGSYLNGGSFNNSGLVTLAVDATTTADASKVVARDSGGNVTANYFIGNGSGLTGVAASTLNNTLSNGSYITGGSFNGSSNVTLAVDATTTATASKVVARDGSGNVYASRFVGELDYSVIPGSYLTGSNFNNLGNVTLAVDATTANTASKIVARNSSGYIYANSFIGGTFVGDGSALTGVAASTLAVPVDELSFWNPNGEAGGTTWVVDAGGVDNSTDGVIAYGAGTYVIGFYGVVQAFPSSGTDPSNQMWSSTDGENWIGTTINGSTGVRVNSIAYGNDMFMVTCNDVTDGVYIATGKATSWGKIFWGGSTGTYSKLCFAYDKFFMYDGSNVKIYDTLTDQWSEENQTGTVHNVVKYGGGILLSVDIYSGSDVSYSYDGITWNSYGSVLPAGVEWSDIIYGRGIWVAAGDSSGTPNLAYSLDNGLTWTAISGGSLASSTTGYLLAYGGGRFVCMSKSNATTNKFYTCDGEITTWTTTNFASSAYYVGLVAGFDGFVAVPQQKANTFDTIYPAYTTDGSGVSSLYEYNTFGTIDGYAIGTTKPGDGTFLSVATTNFVTPDISGFHIGGGSSGKYIATDGTGNLYWGAGGVLGSNTEVQFNDAGSPNGSPGLTFNKYTNTATITNLTVISESNLGNVGNVTITGGSSGQYLKTDGSGNLSWADAALYYNFTSGAASPNAASYPANTVSGFNTYTSTDFPTSYYTGITTKSTTTGAQFAVNWNSEETSPTSFIIRANDDTGTTADWSPWASVWMDTNDGSGSGLDADLLDGKHGNAYLVIDPDGDGVSILYSDQNPTINGSSCGGGWYMGADADLNTGLVDAKFINARNGFVNSSNGYYIGTFDPLSSSGTYTSNLVIDSSGIYQTGLKYNISNSSYLLGGTFDNTGNITLSVDATTTADASKVVARDSGGNVTANYFIGNGSALTGIVSSGLNYTLSNGSYITGGSFNGSANVTLAVNATTANTASTLVARDSGGNITANLITLQSSTSGGITFNPDPGGGSGDGASIRFYIPTSGEQTSLVLATTNDADDHIILNPTGKVGIKNFSPTVALDVTGAILASDNITAYSDASLKTNVVTIQNPLAIINQLRGVDYTRIDTGEDSSGVIAQEVQPHRPMLVKDHNGTLSVNYNGFSGLFIESIKALADKVESLEQEIKRLKGE